MKDGTIRTLLLGLALAMAGCATLSPDARAPNQGSTSYHRVDDGQMAHYQLAIGEVASGGKPLARVLPVYPATQLEICPATVEVRVQVIVDTAGKAIEARRYPAPAAADVPADYYDAVRAAVLQWQFSPLVIGHWAADAEGNTHEVDSVARPYSLVYAFRFACRAGKATVTPAAAG